MRHIISYNEPISYVSTIDDIIERIPEHVRFQLELNIILTEGARAVRGCYERFANDLSSLKESISVSILSQSDIKDLKEGCILLKKHLESTRSNVSEQELVTNAEDIPNANKALDLSADPDLKNLNKEDELGFIGLLDKLGKALTEDYSPIGFLHLALDIVSIIGDIPMIGPVGLIADIVNGLIYMFRDKPLLAILSFVSAAIPFVGPVIKRSLALSKTGKEVGELTSKYFSKYSTGSTKISDEAVELAAAASPASIKALDNIVEHTPKALDIVRNSIDTFFSGFLAKISSYIPFIGKPLEKMFKNIGLQFATFSKKAKNFAKDVPVIFKQAEIKRLDDFFEAAMKNGKLDPSTKIISKGDTLAVVNRSGVVIADVPANLLKGSDALTTKFGGNIDPTIKAVFPGATEKATLEFYKNLEGLLSASKKYQAATIAGKAFIIKKKVAILIGKSIYKIVNDYSHDYFNDAVASESDYEAVGIAQITREMQRKMREDVKNNKGSVYSVPIVDALEDNNAYKLLNGHLDHTAKLLNIPGGFPKQLNKHLRDQYQDDKDVQEYLKTFGMPSSKRLTELKHIQRYN